MFSGGGECVYVVLYVGGEVMYSGSLRCVEDVCGIGACVCVCMPPYKCVCTGEWVYVLFEWRNEDGQVCGVVWVLGIWRRWRVCECECVSVLVVIRRMVSGYVGARMNVRCQLRYM